MQLLITCLMAHRKQLTCKAWANTITGDWIGYQKLVNLFALDQGIAIGYKSSGIQSNSVLQRNLDDAFLARWQFMLFSSLLARCCLSLCTWAAGQFRISSSAYKFNLQLLIHRTHQVYSTDMDSFDIFGGCAYFRMNLIIFDQNVRQLNDLTTVKHCECFMIVHHPKNVPTENCEGCWISRGWEKSVPNHFVIRNDIKHALWYAKCIFCVSDRRILTLILNHRWASQPAKIMFSQREKKGCGFMHEHPRRWKVSAAFSYDSVVIRLKNISDHFSSQIKFIFAQKWKVITFFSTTFSLEWCPLKQMNLSKPTSFNVKCRRDAVAFGICISFFRTVRGRCHPPPKWVYISRLLV